MGANFSDSVVAAGPLVFVSGQVPVAPDGTVAGDAAEQARQVFRNIEAALAPHGAGLGHVVKLTYFLRHISDLEDLREVLREQLSEPRPASTLIEVSGLVDSRFLMEVDAVASLPPAAGGAGR